MTPTPEQSTVIDTVATGTASLIVEAVAGSGKTTTIVNAAKGLRPGRRYVFLAFNKNIADELSARLPYFCPAATFHSLLKRSAFPRARVEPRLVEYLFRDYEPDWKRRRALGAVPRLVSAAKSAGVGYLLPDEPSVWSDLTEFYDIEADIAASRCLLKHPDDTRIDFDDMLYLALDESVTLTQYDLIFIDEAQDTNAVQLALLRKMLAPGGRVIAVGDPHQAIYGFRGASVDALDNIRREFSCETLPLSTCFRCSTSVVAEAQRVLQRPL